MCLLWTTHFIIFLFVSITSMLPTVHIRRRLVSASSISSWAMAESSSGFSRSLMCLTPYAKPIVFVKSLSLSLSPHLHSTPFPILTKPISVVKGPMCQMLHCTRVNGIRATLRLSTNPWPFQCAHFIIRRIGALCQFWSYYLISRAM